MKIDLSRLVYQPYSQEDFYWQGRISNAFLESIEAQLLEPVQVEMTVENKNRFFIGRGRVSTRLGLNCSRCLKIVEYPINSKIFVTLAESSKSHQFAGDDEVLIFNGIEADISPAIEAVIFSNLPLKPLCRETCQGLCPNCGADRNSAICNCPGEELDPRWDKLKKLK